MFSSYPILLSFLASYCCVVFSGALLWRLHTQFTAAYTDSDARPVPQTLCALSHILTPMSSVQHVDHNVLLRVVIYL